MPAMRAIFTIVALLLALAIVGMLAKAQLTALRGSAGTVEGASAPAAGARQIEQKIKDDVTRMMQAAPQRGEPSQ